MDSATSVGMGKRKAGAVARAFVRYYEEGLEIFEAVEKQRAKRGEVSLADITGSIKRYRTITDCGTNISYILIVHIEIRR